MSWNQQLGKKFNKELILKEIFLHSDISRGDIIKETGLKKATVANLVNELIDENLILESGEEASTGGRRSKKLKFNEKAGFALGVDIGVNYIYGVVVNLRGEIIFEDTHTIHSAAFESYFERIISLIHLLISNVPQCPYHIVGLGMAIPGIIDTSGNVLDAPNLYWKNIELKRMLEDKFPFPIYISNEANAGAYAEFTFTQNKEANNLLYLSIGIGLGVGIIINGKIYQGNNGYSGENGHTILNLNGKTCTCGRKGCWEAYASEHAAVKEAENMFNKTSLTLEQLLQYADEGDEKIRKLFQDIGFYIGIGITNLIHTFNPEKIIIGNRMIKAQRYVEPALLETIEANTNSAHFQTVSVEFSSLRGQAIAIGAATFIIDQFIELSSS